MGWFDSSILYWNNQQDAYSKAECYRIGRFVEQSTPRALALYSRAAGTGDSRAMLRLAEHYEQTGQKKRALYALYEASIRNNGEAIRQLETHSDTDALAALLLGRLYETKKNYTQSIVFYKKSHALKHTDGLYHLAKLFSYLSASEKKGKEAIDYYDDAAKNGSKHALAELIELSETSGKHAFYVANIMEHNLKQMDRALVFYEKAASNGHAEAALYLAHRAEGKNNDDLPKIGAYYSQGATSNDEESQAALHRLTKELFLSRTNSLFSENTQPSWNTTAQNMKRK